MIKPIISIIIPIYNRASLIGETLESVIAQTYQNWECIVVDDGSTDGTESIVKSYHLKDARIKLYKNQRSKGGQGARNTGIDLSIGEFIMFLDSDDLLAESCIEKRVYYFQTFEKNEFLVFQSILYNYKQTVDEYVFNLLNKEMDDLSRFIMYDYPWNTSSTLLKKDFIKNNNLYWAEELSIHQDLGFYIRLLSNSPVYKKILDKPDVWRRMNNADKLSANKLDKHIMLGKYEYLNYIFNILIKSKKLKQNKKQLFGLGLSYMSLFSKHGNFLLYLKVPFLFLKNKLYKYAFIIVFDHLYLEIRSKFYNKTFRKCLDFYKVFKIDHRIQFLPPKGSTLGKVNVTDHLKNLKA